MWFLINQSILVYLFERFYFSRFLRWSAIISDKWKLKFVPSGTSASVGVRRRPSAMDFAHYQSLKLQGSSPPITNNRENLGQTSSEYPMYRQNLGWSAESKIHDRLEFSRHMKMERSVSVSSEGIFEITSGGGPLISVGVFPPKFAGVFFFLTNRFTTRLLFTYVGNSEKEERMVRAIPMCSWLARFEQKMSFHFALVSPLVCDWLVWHNGSTLPILVGSSGAHSPHIDFTGKVLREPKTRSIWREMSVWARLSCLRGRSH